VSNENNPFEAAIAALETRRAQVNEEIDADIAKLREIGERMSGMALPNGALAGTASPARIESDTFFNLSYPQAAIKFLGMTNKRPQSTNAIMDAIAQGGLNKPSYNTLYATLARRCREFGDLVNVKGDWGLPEWYGGKPKAKKRVSMNPKDFVNEPEDANASLDSAALQAEDAEAKQ
jgi:hypothetical protein